MYLVRYHKSSFVLFFDSLISQLHHPLRIKLHIISPAVRFSQSHFLILASHEKSRSSKDLENHLSFYPPIKKNLGWFYLNFFFDNQNSKQQRFHFQVKNLKWPVSQTWKSEHRDKSCHIKSSNILFSPVSLSRLDFLNLCRMSWNLERWEEFLEANSGDEWELSTVKKIIHQSQACVQKLKHSM